MRSVAAAVAVAAAAVLCGGCGPKSIAAGSVPFPAEQPVFVDNAGQALRDLPASSEPARLVFLDFVWCPPCEDVWKAVREASGAVPAGSVRVYRILFDRERMLSGAGTAEVGPLRPPGPPDAGTFPVTTLTALPRPFRERFGVEQAPLLLLMDGSGRVARRWTGSFASLPGDIAAAVKSLLSAAPLPEM